ncbi:hypothetical protein BC938DRAFT_478844 [Jimgerdemannia flammicorona]|uniref:Uncharacterized protein n=1 Tax=Jimgerdemannia flammicorona TaxID=994334 RepID=A0A433QM73_9FUNG|nr:hypothetical protein BC938DRAFT_478844 [Jimgerdemannia flammicorona]
MNHNLEGYMLYRSIDYDARFSKLKLNVEGTSELSFRERIHVHCKNSRLRIYFFTITHNESTGVSAELNSLSSKS